MSTFSARTATKRAWKLFSLSTSVVFVAGAGGLYQYHRTYHTISTDQKSLESALKNAGTLDPNVYDVAIVGGGIIGISTAREIQKRYPEKSIILLEKEGSVAQHQSGHPSGCIHAGMYYTPGSAMARLCPRGAEMLTNYCQANGLPFKMCGKLIVGHTEKDAEVIRKLYDNGVANAVEGLQILRSKEEIQAKEPLVHGTVALYSKNTGMVDFGAVTRHMKDQLLKSRMFTVRYNFRVLDFVGVEVVNEKPTLQKSLAYHRPPVGPHELVVIRGREEGQVGPEKRIVAKHVITCCGLGTDPVAATTTFKVCRGPRVAQMYSFRGKYYQLRAEKKDVVKMHVYPCPQLGKGISVGIHISPTINEDRGNHTILGPGSAFAFHPYGYSPYWVDFKYLFNSIFSYGGWVSLLSNAKTMVETYRVDLSRRAFLAEVQKLIPSITIDDIEDSFSGVMGLGVTGEGEMCSDLSLDYTRPRQTIKVQKKHLTGNCGFVFLPFNEKEKPSSTSLLGRLRGMFTRSSAETNHYYSPPKSLIIHVRNAPSPAATACMAIAEEIVAASGSAFMWTKGEEK